MDDARARGGRRIAVRRRDHEHIASNSGHRLDGEMKQGPAVNRFDQLVATEPGRSAAGEHDPADGKSVLAMGHAAPVV